MDKFLSILTLNHFTGLDFNTRSSGGGGDISLASVGLVVDRPAAGSCRGGDRGDRGLAPMVPKFTLEN